MDGQRGPNGSASDPNSPAEVPGAATLSVTGPGSYVSPGTVQVTGEALNLTDFTVNGQSIDTADGTFSTTVSLSEGAHVIDIGGLDGVSLPRRELVSVIAGDFAAPEGFVDSAVQVHIGAAEIEGLGALAEGFLDPAQLTDMVVPMNPVIDTPDLVADIEEIRFQEPLVAITPDAGFLAVSVIIPSFEVDIDVSEPLGVSGTMSAAEVLLDLDLALDTDGAGNLVVDLPQGGLDFTDFDIDIDGFLGLFAGLVIDPADIELMILEEIEPLLADLPATLNAELAQLELGTETEILEQTLGIDAAFGTAAITPDGLFIGVDVQADVVGATASGDGHLLRGAPAAPTGEGLSLVIADDFMNRFLHELWAGGALDIELPIEAGDPLLGLFVSQLGGDASIASSITMEPSLPPTWIGDAAGSRLQLGGMVFTVATPGGTYGDEVAMQMFLDAAASVEIGPEGAGLRLSGATVRLNPIGEAAQHAELFEMMPNLETQIGLAGLGAINGMLTFELGDIALPELAIEREPSARGLMLALSVEDLMGLLDGTPNEPSDPIDPNDPNTTPDPDPNTTPNPTPPAPGSIVEGDPLEVAIPSGTPVHDDDATVTGDGMSGWICRRDEVDVEGSNGTWYVDDRGELTILTGTGHTIYAMDDAEITLHTGGNIVYADEGADVEDLDGTNTVLFMDPVSFDTSNAPEDGC